MSQPDAPRETPPPTPQPYEVFLGQLRQVAAQGTGATCTMIGQAANAISSLRAEVATLRAERDEAQAQATLGWERAAENFAAIERETTVLKSRLAAQAEALATLEQAMRQTQDVKDLGSLGSAFKDEGYDKDGFRPLTTTERKLLTLFADRLAALRTTP